MMLRLMTIALLMVGLVDSGPTLTLDQGVLEGRTLETIGSRRQYHSYQGVPYALPPLGDLRFMPPQPHLKWEGVLQASDDTKKCPQKDAIFDDYAHGEEDCLILNVYTPTNSGNSSEKLAVMFWIHGGGFTSGSSSTNFFGPDYFMDEDVVLVTVNYRLGVLGFMNLEDDVVTGNMGLKDVVLALKWVQSNIATFGGDKNRVTIFGNNAGGAIVSLLTHSSMAQGLFEKAICQSGVAKLPQLFGDQHRERAFRLAKILRKSPKDSQALLKAFDKLTAYDFVKAAPRTFDSTEVRDAQKNILPFGPTIEKNGNATEAFLDKTPDEWIDPSVPLMIGFNSREAIVYLGKIIHDPKILDNLNYNFQFALPFRGLEFAYNSETYNAVASRIRKFYFKDGIIDSDSVAQYMDYVSDGIFYPVSQTVQDYLRVATNPVYYYQFSHEGSLNYYKRSVAKTATQLAGASNGDEICYLFRCEALNDEYVRAHKQSSGDAVMIARMVRMWTNFAKFGNPTPPNDTLLNGFIWKPATLESMNYLNINESMEMDQNPRSESVQFWNDIYKTYAKAKIKDVKTEL